MKQDEYTKLVAQMAHGILCACASPQFAARIDALANAEPVQDFHEVVADMAQDQLKAILDRVYGDSGNTVKGPRRRAVR